MPNKDDKKTLKKLAIAEAKKAKKIPANDIQSDIVVSDSDDPHTSRGFRDCC